VPSTPTLAVPISRNDGFAVAVRLAHYLLIQLTENMRFYIILAD